MSKNHITGMEVRLNVVWPKRNFAHVAFEVRIITPNKCGNTIVLGKWMFSRDMCEQLLHQMKKRMLKQGVDILFFSRC